MNEHPDSLALRQKAAGSPRLAVSREEFLRLAEAAGFSAERAKDQALFAEVLGSSVLIGGQMLSISAD